MKPQYGVTVLPSKDGTIGLAMGPINLPAELIVIGFVTREEALAWLTHFLAERETANTRGELEALLAAPAVGQTS